MQDYISVFTCNWDMPVQSTENMVLQGRSCTQVRKYVFQVNINQYKFSRTHGNKSRQPHHALRVEDIQHVVKYINNYAETHAILLPGRIPGYKNYSMQLLPSSSTKKAVWENYSVATESISQRIVGFSAFCKYWKKYMPHVIITKLTCITVLFLF